MKRLTPIPSNRPLPCLLARLQIVAAIVFFLGTVGSAHGADFFCSTGDVTCLIASIKEANGRPGAHTINLEPGIYSLQTVDNSTDGNNGLPSITGSIEIKASADNLPVVEPGVAPVPIRIFHVSVGGELTLKNVIIQKGRGGFSVPGTAIFNRGTILLQDSVVTDSRGQSGVIDNFGRLTISGSIISNNLGFYGGGGMFTNEIGGVVLVENSTIDHNRAPAGAGILNRGSLVLRNTSIAFNQTDGVQHGGGIYNSGSLEILNSTIAGNEAGLFGGGGLWNSTGQVLIINSTIRENQGGQDAGGIANFGGTIRLQDSIIAGNRAGAPDCSGEIMSLGNNLVGDPRGCDINLQATDLTGDPGLGAFIDDGAPGHARYPLLATSPAIDAGNGATCPATDQLGNPRVGICDIGAIEFYPLINDLVSLASISTAFDPTPLSNAPAGTFSITAEFINTSAESILHHFAEVTEITGGDLLLNADGGAGGVGAQLTPAQNSNSSLVPGTSETVQFVIGLQAEEPFTFFINMRGDAR